MFSILLEILITNKEKPKFCPKLSEIFDNIVREFLSKN